MKLENFNRKLQLKEMISSKKSKIFENEPLKDKEIIDVPGIGEIYSAQMIKFGITKADELLGYFLIFKKNDELFELWLNEEFEMQKIHAKACCNGFKNWCDNFL